MTIPSALRRRVAAVILFVLMAGLAVVTAGYENMAAQSPRKRSDIALAQAVSENMTAAQLRHRARMIASDDPMHAVGFFFEVMALDLEKQPLSKKQHGLIAAAAQRQPSFAAPRIWLIADAIRKDKYAEAVNGADTVMRLNGEFRKLLVPILVPLLAEQKARPLVIKKLGEFPAWRTEFVVEAIASGAHDSTVERILQDQAPPSAAAALAAERSAYLKRLIEDGEAARAHKLWRGFVGSKNGTAIADGRFTDNNPIHPFAWQLAAAPYSYAEKIPASQGSPALVRAHHDGAGKMSLLLQMVALAPGSRELVFTMRDGGLGEPEQLVWRIRCLGADTALASRSLAKLAPDWQKVRMRVTIPDNGCALQYLSLDGENNDGAESEVEIRSVESN